MHDAADQSRASQHTLPRSRRLSRDRDFQAVFAARLRRGSGPLLVYVRANELHHPRLGLSVSRRVGGAVVRNRIKRLLREAFRHIQHDLPGAYDVIIVPRPHEPLPVAGYQSHLLNAVQALHLKCAAWKQRPEQHERQPPMPMKPRPTGASPPEANPPGPASDSPLEA